MTMASNNALVGTAASRDAAALLNAFGDLMIQHQISVCQPLLPKESEKCASPVRTRQKPLL